jgi:hypothetical protein
VTYSITTIFDANENAVNRAHVTLAASLVLAVLVNAMYIASCRPNGAWLTDASCHGHSERYVLDLHRGVDANGNVVWSNATIGSSHGAIRGARVEPDGIVRVEVWASPLIGSAQVIDLWHPLSLHFRTTICFGVTDLVVLYAIDANGTREIASADHVLQSWIYQASARAGLGIGSRIEYNVLATRPIAMWCVSMAALVMVVFHSVMLGVRGVIAMKRRARGLCIRCGYDIRGVMRRCPECGCTHGLEARATEEVGEIA